MMLSIKQLEKGKLKGLVYLNLVTCSKFLGKYNHLSETFLVSETNIGATKMQNHF